MIAFKVTLGTWDYFQTWFLALTDFLKYQSLRMIDHLLHPITDYNFSDFDFEQNNLHLLSPNFTLDHNCLYEQSSGGRLDLGVSKKSIISQNHV